MMKLENFQNQLDQARKRLSAIESDLAEKQVAYDAAEMEYAEHYASYSHLSRKPKSVTTQREKTLKLRVELDALQKALAIYQDKVAECERNVALCELAQSQKYTEEQGQYKEQTKSLVAACSGLISAIEIFNDNARRFFENPSGPIQSLRAFATNPLFADFSLEHFLEGKIKAVTNNENAVFLDKHEQKLLKQASASPLISEELLDELQWWATALVQFASNPASATRRSYLPADKRPVQAITTSTVMQVPRYARGGPEMDEDDPRSDKAFFMRRRFRKTIQASRPISKEERT